MVKTKVVKGKTLFFCPYYKLWLTPEGCEKYRKNPLKRGRNQSFVCKDSYVGANHKCKKCSLWKQVKNLDKLSKCPDCGRLFIPRKVGNTTIKNICYECYTYRKNVLGVIVKSFKKVFVEDKSVLERLQKAREKEGSYKNVFQRLSKKI